MCAQTAFLASIRARQLLPPVMIVLVGKWQTPVDYRHALFVVQGLSILVMAEAKRVRRASRAHLLNRPA